MSSSTQTEYKQFHPNNIFGDLQYAIVLLNCDHKIPLDFLVTIWNKAAVRVTIDGGANFLYNLLKKDMNFKVPELISGDFDSVAPDVLQFMRSNGQTQVIETTDQDETDFTKGLRVLQEYIDNQSIVVNRVIVVLEHSGRLDHTMSNINTLHKSPLKTNVDLYLLSCNALTWLFRPDVRNVINFSQSKIDKVCGIIPFQGPTRMRSCGLKWNLNDATYSFGSMISTSNQVINSEMWVESDTHASVFTVEMLTEDFVTVTNNS